MLLNVGGVLVFLTGQHEVQMLVKKLSKRFPFPNTSEPTKNDYKLSENSQDESHELFNADIETENDFPVDDFEYLEEEFESDNEEEAVEILGDIIEEKDCPIDEKVQSDSITPLYVLPLYSMLPTKQQLKVFENPPAGCRLAVIATNVAETSLTIPNIRYVVDAGKVKERSYDTYTGVQKFQLKWTSKASSDQRAGRAGRMGPGHCYRLFSSAVFNEYFPEFSVPEIQRVPIEGVVLQMKSMGINQVIGFPFPTPPLHSGLLAAEKLLKNLGALDIMSKNLQISQLGSLMSLLPVSPRYAKMLIVAAKQSEEIFNYIICIVSGLSVGDPFIRDTDLYFDTPKSDKDEKEVNDIIEKEERSKKRGQFFKVMQVTNVTD